MLTDNLALTNQPTHFISDLMTSPIEPSDAESGHGNADEPQGQIMRSKSERHVPTSPIRRNCLKTDIPPWEIASRILDCDRNHRFQRGTARTVRLSCPGLHARQIENWHASSCPTWTNVASQSLVGAPKSILKRKHNDRCRDIAEIIDEDTSL